MSDQTNTSPDSINENDSSSRSEQITSVAVAASCVYTSYRVGRGVYHLIDNLLASRNAEPVTVKDPQTGEVLTGEVVNPD